MPDIVGACGGLATHPDTWYRPGRGTRTAPGSRNMGEIIGLGCTHYPGLLQPDERLPGGFHHLLTAPNVPAHYKDRANWPAELLAELGNDDGRVIGAALWRAHGRRLPRRPQGARRVRPGPRADLGRRPVRELPRGHHPGVLPSRPRRAVRAETMAQRQRRQAQPLERIRRLDDEAARRARRCEASRPRADRARHRHGLCLQAAARRRAWRTPSPTRCCIWTGTATASPGRCCRSPSTATAAT